MKDPAVVAEQIGGVPANSPHRCCESGAGSETETFATDVMGWAALVRLLRHAQLVQEVRAVCCGADGGEVDELVEVGVDCCEGLEAWDG